jgi:carbonic anhydrase
MSASEFDDVIAANAAYAEHFALAGLKPEARRGLAVLTCMDSRIEPLQLLGLVPGDAKILRNGGGRVTDDVIRTLTVAVHLLGVERVIVMGHTQCGVLGHTDDELHAGIAEAGGPPTDELEFLAQPDPEGSITADVERLRGLPYFKGVTVGGFIYDVATGRIAPVC